MQSFNSLRLFVLVVLTFGAAGNLAVQVGRSDTVAIDEFGTGTQTGVGSLVASIAVDPLSGIATLSYALPFPVTPGDLILTEPATTEQVSSDLIRFEPTPGTNNSSILFFSDTSTLDPADAPADQLVFPTTLQTNVATVAEVGIEAGPNGLIYSPLGALPGSLPTGGAITYDIVSDGRVPEPSTCVLFGLGTLSLFLAARRRRRGA